MKLFLFISLGFIVTSCYGAQIRIDPLVYLPQGLVRGQKANDADYSYFLGIPYAQVDLNNPFGPALAAPVLERNIFHIFNAYDGSIKCPQDDDQGTLDCLALNIYVPGEASTQNPLPVLVWIHGGDFNEGYAGQYHPKDLVTKGIIVVTINYRLGPYGFMCLDSPQVPGNQGLKDQYDALHWIRENIRAFGGNPYKVTLAGHNAGACSALLHLYYPKDKFFEKVIAQSGTPLNEGMFVNGDINAAIKLAGHLGFNATSTDQALEFLTNASPDLVVGAAKDLDLILRPCKEKSYSGIQNFVETDPFSMNNEKNIRKTPIIIGHTSKDRLGFINFNGDDYFQNKLKENFNFDEEQLTELSNIVKHYYIGDEKISIDMLSQVEEFDSDFVSHHATHRTINRLLAQNAAPVYQYLFSYTEDPDETDATLFSELSFLFHLDDHTTQETKENQLIIDRITTLWANFVKFGNPTPEVTEILPVVWEPSSSETRPYLVIDTEMQLDHRVYKERMSFWDLFYSTYAKDHALARDLKCQTGYSN